MSKVIYKERVSMPVVPLKGVTFFPGMVLSFDILRDKSQKSFEAAMSRGQNVLLLRQKEFANENPAKDDLCALGTIAEVRSLVRLSSGGIRVLVEGTARGSVERFTAFNPYIEALVNEVIPVKAPDTVKTRAMCRILHNCFEEYARINELIMEEVVDKSKDIADPGELCDYICGNAPMNPEAKQMLLECLYESDRIEKCCIAIMSETELYRAESRIKEEVGRQVDKNQRDYILREQLHAIQDELGEGDGNAAENYREKVEKLISDPDSKEKLLRDIANFERYGQNPQEASLMRGYLDTVLELPWKTRTTEHTDVLKVKKRLDDDHYGLEKVKERILDYIAVKQLSPDSKNQIICLVGPPGVGKTSVAISIAAALGRKLARVSLGGVRDEAEIRGHRKTYIGAMPGRIITAIAQCKTKNPLLLLDEIDKLGADYKGDPSSALLEVLDSEQNHSFRDHYIEVPFDLSEVMFITTANDASMIPPALLDRMEIIELGSYTEEEKLHIASEHLLGKQLKAVGLNKRIVRMDETALRFLIRSYTREAGVRTLERRIASCCRKAARELVENPSRKSVKITPEKIVEWLGPERVKPERDVLTDKVGVVNGLAWTSVGGELLQVEVNIVKGKGEIKITGNLGEVMKESCQAAISFIRSRAAALAIDPEFYSLNDIHIHFPEGAVPKDGPSAGVTITTAIISALTGRKVLGTVAMTGEVTLRGRVLPIGGLKEKSMAAFKAGIKTVLIPADNEPDLYDVDKAVLDSIRFIPVSGVDEILAVALEPVTVVDVEKKTESFSPAYQPVFERR